jgi:hypothetical protein
MLINYKLLQASETQKSLMPWTRLRPSRLAWAINTFKGFNSAFLIVSGHKQQTELTINRIEAAKEARLKFLLVLSVLTSGTDSMFGKQFKPIEAKVKEMILIMPLFTFHSSWITTMPMLVLSTAKN